MTNIIETADCSRRQFIAATAAGTVAVLAAPAIHTAAKSPSKTVIGKGDYQFEVVHGWAQLPDKYTWQTTHNVAVDQGGNVYVIHEGRADQKEHPAIFVFDAEGKFIRAFGEQYQGGGHGLEVHEENGEEFLYVTAYQHLKRFAKLSLAGEVVWERRAPMASNVYAAGEDTDPKQVWGRDRFMPTNVAFHPDGGFYVADGYGAWRIHRYDRDAQWVSSFGQPGKGDGEFNLPHGVWVDNRPGREASVVVADRANARLQWFTLDGKHLQTLDGFILPANVDAHDELLLVPDLSARITLLDGKNQVVAQLGEDDAWRAEVLKDGMKLRTQPDRWQDGKFIHPHDACFDSDGNILVAEWVATGRVSKLRKL